LNEGKLADERLQIGGARCFVFRDGGEELQAMVEVVEVGKDPLALRWPTLHRQRVVLASIECRRSDSRVDEVLINEEENAFAPVVLPLLTDSAIDGPTLAEDDSPNGQASLRW
jgi:hypothetical protein